MALGSTSGEMLHIFHLGISSLTEKLLEDVLLPMGRLLLLIYRGKLGSGRKQTYFRQGRNKKPFS